MRKSQSVALNCVNCSTCAQVEWAGLEPAGLDYLSKAKRTFDYQPGESIFHQGDDPQGIYCIEQGNILLRQFDRAGNEVGFRVIMDGETIGWRSYFAEQAHAATALALTACRVCLIPASDLIAMMKAQPSLAHRFLKTISRDRGPADGLLLRNPQLPVRIRLINFLIILGEHLYANGDNRQFSLTLPLQRQQIASMIGTRSETLSRTIAELEASGLVHFVRREVRIPDYGNLLRESERAG